MPNPWMRMWLSAANSWAGAARGRRAAAADTRWQLDLHAAHSRLQATHPGAWLEYTALGALRRVSQAVVRRPGCKSTMQAPWPSS
jgi:hypothetical protein